MLERLKDCICHPRFIGKYNKDKIGKIIIFIILFFLLYLGVFAVRCYTENPFGENASSEIVSSVITSKEDSVVYDETTNSITGKEVVIKGKGYALYVLPTQEILLTKYEDFNSVNIVLDEYEAYVYYGTIEVSNIRYSDIKVKGFKFENVIKNDVHDIYNFNIFIQNILESSFVFFQSFLLLDGAISGIITYFLLVLICFAFAALINPGIDRGVRFKLCLYDGLVFFVFLMLAALFNAGWLVYVGYSLPVIYTLITFKHIIKVVIKK